MAVVVCQHCKAAQKMSFWELHTRLGQCYEEETSHSQNSHHYHPPQEHGIKISGSCKSFEHPGMTSPGYGHGQDVHASHSHNVLLSAVKHEEHELITPSASGRRRQSVGRANFHPILPGQLQAVKPPEEEASVVSFVQARRSSLVGSGTPAQMLQRSWSRGSGLTAGDPIAKEKKRLPHDCWAKQKSVRPLLSQRAITRSSANGAASSVNVVNGAEDEGPERKSWAAWCVQHPGRPFRNVWDILAVVFLVHDMIVIPLRFFDVPEALVLDLLSWFTQIFWNLDIIASFLTGYYQDGNLVMEPVKIALNYAKTWLAFDMTVVSLDWIILLLAADSDAQGVHRLSKTVRVLRFLRMVRILRLAKISRMSEAVQEQIQSQSANIHYSLFKSIFRLLLLCHLMACSWHQGGR
ncbi:Potassium/sodium hyperpolarization-activated cyclic nucleotide-gated channel 2 [Symbiodinium microadriaticum]|uniref:Potassium/sodium hyperpolarization-activated cyclic nucleotide-gated channel 2 n=1 Tax=Symbiodinium microadriaticum TaxID=2951 RepID=A0A1Q9EKL3_SYMMI|nr:Potassium/sodium hyperpolarization-activated cyclic nucleotide-gated channel 2 [Symbiodinium microadriaticum]